MDEQVFTVSELTELIKTALEEGFPGIWVTGEISNYLRHSSGHRYFTLKDAGAQIKCVMWKFVGQYLAIEPENGMKVRLFGDVTVYAKNGQYQLRVTRIMPLGIGDLEIRFQELKERLFREGLFAEEHKKPLPEFPEAIGIVTSPTGAAIRDLVNIIRRRAPWVEIILAPVHVQGKGAAEEIAQAIARFNRYGEVDLIIAGRGGGSLEDLWAFNEEVVARAIYDSRIPVISAVGHEIDYTIADFVADLRAPTPSAAAELAVPDREELRAALIKIKSKLSRGALTYVELAREKLNGLQRRPVLRKPLEFIYARAQELDEIRAQMSKRISDYLEMRKGELRLGTVKLLALSPLGILRRGFAVVRSEKSGRIIREAKQVAMGEGLNIRLHSGRLGAVVNRRTEESD